MSVSVQVPYKKYTAAAAATVFPTTFRVVLAGDLQVRVDAVVVTSGFTLSALGLSAGVDVTFTTPMVGGEVVELQRIIPKSRANDYQQLGNFDASVVNADIDRLWMSNQELGEEVSRAILVPIGSGTDPQDLIDELITSAATAVAAAGTTTANVVAAQAAADAAAASAASIALPLPATSGGTGVTSIAALRALLGIYDAETGDLQPTMAPAARAGWVMASGRTIGNASSSATERANADTSALFTMLWTGLADAEAPVSSGRGASAAADFAANKTITLPDLRGRAIVGKDNMGGTTASRITSAGAGFDGTVLGKSGGAQTHTLTEAQLAPHTHPQNIGSNNGTSGGSPIGSSGSNAGGAGFSTSSAGSGSAHNNTQPSYIANVMVKL